MSTLVVTDDWSDVDVLCFLTQLLINISIYEESAGTDETRAIEFLRHLASCTLHKIQLAQISQRRKAA